MQENSKSIVYTIANEKIDIWLEAFIFFRRKRNWYVIK